MVVNIKSGTRADWLIIFLVLDSLDLHDPVDAFLKEVKNVTLKKKNKVFFLTDRIKPKNLEDNFSRYELSLNEFVYNARTNETVLVPVQIEGVDPLNGYEWQEALRQIYIINRPRFSTLITWSHGSGIGMVESQDPKLIIKKNQFTIIRNVRFQDHPFNAETPDCMVVEKTNNALIVNNFPDDTQCRELRHLFISQIADGFKDLSKKPVFDIMVMGNCNMQMVDNCYNLKKVARFYFAPITAIQLSGYDFAGFIKAINNGSITGTWLPFFRRIFYRFYLKKISRLFINGYIRLNPLLEKGAAITVNDLKQMTNLPLLLNNFCAFFNSHYEVVYPIIDNILKNGDLHFSEKDFIDMVLLFDAIQKELKNEAFDNLYYQLKKHVLDGILVDRHIGSELKETDFHCFSIYIPATIDHVISRVFCCQYFRDFGNSQFVKDTAWDNFVTNFTRWRAQHAAGS